MKVVTIMDDSNTLTGLSLLPLLGSADGSLLGVDSLSSSGCFNISSLGDILLLFGIVSILGGSKKNIIMKYMLVVNFYA